MNAHIHTKIYYCKSESFFPLGKMIFTGSPPTKQDGGIGPLMTEFRDTLLNFPILLPIPMKTFEKTPTPSPILMGFDQ